MDENKIQSKDKYIPTKEEVERINTILAVGDAFLVIERYLIGCIFLIKACKNVILNKIQQADGKKISNDKGKEL